MRFNKYSCLSIFLFLLITVPVAAQQPDSTQLKLFPVHLDSAYNRFTENRFYKMLRIPVPLFVISGITYGQGEKFRTIHNTYTPKFRYHYDDFIQYAPLVAVLGMKLGGVKGRSSWGRMLVSDVFSATLMASAVNGLKYSIHRTRPDGSAHNSFPSGHTATAFMAATIMHHEYGLTRSPLYSIGGYTVATATAFSRQLNNRHWLSDVLAGAGIGILSTELGYFLADLIFKDKGLLMRERLREDAPRNGRPSFLEFGVGYSIINGSIEIGKNIRLASPGATHVSIKGGYFFTSHLGIGGEISAMASPMSFDMSLYDKTNTPTSPEISRIFSDPTGVFSVTAGPLFSLPVASKLLIGTKLQGGYAYFTGSQVEIDMHNGNNQIPFLKNVLLLDGHGSSNFLVRTGISATGIVNRNLGFRMYIDYDYTLLHAPYKLLTNPGSDAPVYTDMQYSKHHLHYFTIGAAVTALFW